MGRDVLELASLGGQARAKKLSAAERSAIAREAAGKRWANHDGLIRATHEGALHIGDVEIACAVLEDGRRVLTQGAFLRALGRARQSRKSHKWESGDDNLPVFLQAKNLKPFISNDLFATSKPVEFRRVRGRTAYGYAAELLPMVCNVFLDARDARALLPSQQHIAAMCQLLVRGLSTVGLAALIDEATGYQEVRDRKALQAILDAYLSKELAAWANRFPSEFYQEIFRLRGWTWDDVKNKSANQGPRVLGKYTNDFVYARLAPGILEELQRRNPPNEKGRRLHAHHQWLTEDVGHPALAQHLHALIGLLRASDTWDQWLKMLNRAFPRRTNLTDLPLFQNLEG